MNPKRVTRKLRAILSADVQGYSRLMGDDEVATVKTITEYREIFSSIVTQFNGRVVDSPGDNILSEFASVVDAVQCAVEIQKVLKAKNEELPENRRMIFRIGVNLGDVIHEDDRIYGDGVNIAARIESLADAGGICISGSAYEQIKNKLALGYNYLGEHPVKNISEPVQVYKVPMGPGDVVKKTKPKLAKNAAIAVALAIILVAAAIVWNSYFRTNRTEPANLEKMAFSLPDKPSIAVLPFDNMSGDPKQDYLCDGISEQIIASLSQVPGIFVIARNSSFTFKGKSIKVQKISEELGVQYVLEGSLQKSGDQIRITVQLIDAITGKHIWADKYDRQLKELFALQDEITMHILTALRVNLTEGEQARIYSAGTKNIDAYLKLMKGLQFYQSRTREGTLKGIQLFEEAISLDPNYANAYVLLSWALIQDAVSGFTKSPAGSWKKAFKSAQTALSLGNADANAHALMSFLLVLLKNKPEEGISEGEKAVALAPNSADINAIFGMTLSHAKRYGEAISKFKEAIRLNPFPPDWYVSEFLKIYRMSGLFDEDAFSTMKWALDRDPDNFNALAWYSWVLGAAGRYTKAIETSKKAIRLNPKHPYYYQVFLGLNYFLAERYDEAIAPFKEAISKAPKTPWGNLGLIASYIQLGRDEDAHKIAKKFLEGRPGFSAEKWLDTSSFKNAGDRERFAEAFRKVGLMEKKPDSKKSENAVPLPLPDKPSIAVLPFANISGDPKEDYLSDGITEQIITALSKTPKLFVIARNSVFTYKGKPVKVQQVSRDLGVRYVLEGSVQKSKDNVRITAQLIDATTGEHVWAERYDRKLTDIFVLQDEITMQVLTALRVKLTDGEQLLIYGGGTKNLESYTKFLQGLYKVHRNEKGTYRAAIKKFEEVISLDPRYPAPYFWLAWAQRWIIHFDRSVDPKQSLAKAMSTVKKGIALDDSNAFALSVLSLIYQAQGQHEKAVSISEKAVALEPNMAEAHAWLGVSLHYVGRYNEAIAHLNKAIRLNPIPPGYYHLFLGNAYQLAGLYEESIAAYKKSILFNPNHLFPHMRLAVTYSLIGREKDAHAEAAEVLRINPKFSAERFIKIVPYKNKAVKDLLLEGMHKAGLK